MSIEKKRTNWKLISRILFGMWILFIAYSFFFDNSRDEKGCWCYLAITRSECSGRAQLLDTLPPNGVGIYVDNKQKRETYEFYSDSLVVMVRNKILQRGDSIFKEANSRYGYIIKPNGERYNLTLITYREECEALSQFEKDSILRVYPVDFYNRLVK